MSREKGKTTTRELRACVDAYGATLKEYQERLELLWRLWHLLTIHAIRVNQQFIESEYRRKYGHEQQSFFT
jgi:hypothetical protein